MVHESIYQSCSYEHVQFREHSLRFFLDKDFRSFLLSQSRTAVFHFHSVFIPWFLPAVRLLRRNGFRRIVLTPHGQYVDAAMRRSLKKRVFFRFFDRNVLRTVDVVHVIGHTEINRYIEDNARAYRLIPNGCQPQRKGKVCSQSLAFGYLGRLDIAQKGLDTLIKAFAFYRRQGGTAVMTVAGGGSDGGRLKEMCNVLGVSGQVRFAGKVFGGDKGRFLEGCSFFIHPSNWDGIPTACMEAAACGVPLIVSRATNLDIYVEKYRCGFVMPDDGRPVQALAEQFVKAERLFADKNSYGQMCATALKMVDEELNWDIIAMKVVKELYNAEDNSIHTM
ncbi:MAG: glycosyltransferase family 4 protein [Prevotella sp.]